MVIKTGIDWAKRVWRRGTRRWGKKKKLERKAGKLEKYRAESVQIIANYQATIEAMAQRPRVRDDPLDEKLLESTRKRIGEILDSAKSASSKSTLRDLKENASEQETYRAYLCPRGEIGMEGKLATNLIEWWGIPKTETETLRKLLEQSWETGDDDPGCARSALQKLYKELEEWGDYREDYEDLMGIVCEVSVCGCLFDAYHRSGVHILCLLVAPVGYLRILDGRDCRRLRERVNQTSRA
jgi:hypothetical protein